MFILGVLLYKSMLLYSWVGKVVHKDDGHTAKRRPEAALCRWAAVSVVAEGGELALQQAAVAQVEFDQAAQVADRFEVDVLAEEAQ